MPKLRAFGELVEAMGTEETILERIAMGETLLAIAKAYGTDRHLLYRWMRQTPERKARYLAARACGARALLEDTVRIADDSNPNEAQKAKLQIEARARLAGTMSAALARPGQRIEEHKHTHLHVGALHLDALRKRAGPDQLAMTPRPNVVDAEVLAVLPAGMSEAEQDELAALL